MTTPFKRVNKHPFALTFLFTAFLMMLLLYSCKKEDERSSKPGAFTAAVLDKWITLQLRLLRNATGTPNQGFARHVAYSGVAALESLAPGLPAHTKWTERWNGLTGLPPAKHNQEYYFPANVNAALAAINKAFFPNATAADKAAIDSLETALQQSFLAKRPQAILSLSADYGKAVAAAVFNWAEADGYKNANNPYTPPAGPGLWKATPPAFATASTPYWGANRPIVKGSIENTQPAAPPAYSTDVQSPFYQMVKKVYDVSQSLTDEQKACALFWRDVPGATSPGHWLSILQQVVQKTNSPLDKAALAYALTGAGINDGLISCFKAKYQYNLVRPVTYIQEVMGHSTWTSFVGTPPHPEYASAHSALSAAAAAVLQKLYGNIGPITDHTYDYMGFTPRTYASFSAIAEEAGKSRLYAGIHYEQSIEAGMEQGEKVAANIFKQNLFK